MTPCRICQSTTKLHFRALVLNKYDAAFNYCEACDFVFAEEPHWLDEAYTDAIVKTDTDIAVRNILTALRLAAILYFGFEGRGKAVFADVAGGYGLLTRLMRDLGFDYRWSDPYATNLFARGFEYSETAGPCEAVSAIEVLEHTLEPLSFLRSSLESHGADTMLFTTQLFPDGKPPAADKWHYYSFETGQHIAFFSDQGLRKLGARLELHYHPLGRIHLLTRRAVSSRRLAIASHRVLALPLAFAAVRSLGSKRGADRTLLAKSLASGS